MSLWLPVVFWCAVIFFLSSIPNLKIEFLGFWDLVLRKIAHIIEFGILAALMYRAFNGTLIKHQASKNQVHFWSGFLSFVYAVTDEYHQYFVPGRYPSVVDIVLDSIGIVLALAIIKNVQLKTKNAVKK